MLPAFGPTVGSNTAPLFTGEPVSDLPLRHNPTRGDDDYVAPDLPPRRPRRSPVALLALLAVIGLTVAAHAVAATFAAAWVATAGEARFAAAVMAIRDAAIPAVALLPWDRFAALQLAVVQLALPAGDPTDTTRWACLVLGALATLLLWPAVLRATDVGVGATAVATGTVGVALPTLMLHSGVTTAVVGALWLSLAAVLAAGNRSRAAAVVALIAVASVPLVAAMLLAMAAVMVVDDTIRMPSAVLRRGVGTGAAVAALGVVLGVVVPGGRFAATTGPVIPTAAAVVAVVVVGGLIVVAGLAERALRPVLVAAAPLVVVGLVPGPSAAAAGVLVVPVLVVALAIVVSRARVGRAPRPLRLLACTALIVVLAVPAAVAATTPIPSRAPLTAWVLSQTDDTVAVAADVLDRAELQAAGFPAARLRGPADPLAPTALRLVSARPGAVVTPCPSGAVLASTPSGTGGAAAEICGPLTPATLAEQAVRSRFGTQLSGNPSLKLDGSAAAALRAGTVDPRLMLTLAALTNAHRVGVSAFSAVPLDAPGALRRTVVLSSFDGSSPAASPLLQRFLAAQQVPFVPSSITVDGSHVVIGYSVPAPTGLLPV